MKNNEELYKTAFELLLKEHAEILENKYCHWNCRSDRDCHGCERFTHRFSEYWIKESKKELKKKYKKHLTGIHSV